jgi:hemolysin III
MSDHALSAVALERPVLRGWLHLFAAGLAAGGAALLLLVADSPTGYVGGALFGASLVALYTTSATYHQVAWRPNWRHMMKRLDHAMIFVLIAGTYTPFCLDVGLGWGIPLLSVVWSLAGAGALLKVVWPDAPRWLSVGLYVGLGWIALIGASEVVDHYLGSAMALLIAGGVLYTIGGLVYALQRPDPWPRIFGYHEVFHALVVAGSAVHYTAVAVYVV